MINLAPYPFIRIFLPMALGILLFNFIIPNVIMYILPIVCIIIYAVIRFNKSPFFQHKYSYLYNIALFGILTFTGWLCANFHQPHTLPDNIVNKEIVFTLQVEDIKQNNTTTDIIGNTILADREHKLLTTLKGNKYNIEIGDTLYCKSKIEPIRNVSIPDAFDYVSYMRNQGILYKCYIDSETNYHIAGHENTLRYYANQIKKNIISEIRKLELNETTTSFIITLLTGDKKFIDQNTRDIFSSAGIAHCLAISGLHIIILAFILGLILKPLVWMNHRNWSFVISIMVIWAFTYMTGLSSSAIRASIMTTLLFSAIIIHRKYSIVNSLFMSATIIIIFNPYALFDIGFQLSYSAVLGIICFAKKFTFGAKGSLLRKTSEVLAVTVAAQIGTFLLILYYFNSLSVSFFISNLIIIPILPLFILVVLFALIISTFGIIVIPLTKAIDLIYSIFNNIAEFSASIPYTQFTDLYLNGYSAFALFLAIISLGIWQTRKNIYFLRATTIFLFIGCFYIVIDTLTLPKHGFFVASDYTSTNIVYYQDNHAYIVNADNNTEETEAFLKHNTKFFIKHHIGNISIIDTPYKNATIFYQYPLLSINGTRIAFAEGNINKLYTTDSRLKTDYLIISKAYYNDVKSLLKHFDAEMIVLPLNIYEQKKDILIKDLKEMGIPYLDLENEKILQKNFN